MDMTMAIGQVSDHHQKNVYVHMKLCFFSLSNSIAPQI